MRTFLVLCFLVFSISVFSQNTKVDSLKIELQNHKKKDTTRVDILYDLAFAHYISDKNLTNLYIQEAKIISDSLNYGKGKANVLNIKGILASRKGNFEEGLDYFKQSLQLFQSLSNKKGIASGYNAIGVIYLQQSKNNEALEYLKKAMTLFEEIGDKNNLIAGLLNSGNIHANIGSYPEAISYYKRVITLSKEINHQYGEPYAHSNLGHIYAEQGNIALALDHYNQGLHFKEKEKDSLGMSISLNSLGITYKSIGNLDKALEYHNRSLDIALKYENKNLIAINKSNIGRVYKRKKDYNKALEYVRESLKISVEIKDLGQQASCLNNIGEVNLLLNKPLVAREHFEKANVINLNNNNKFGSSLNYLGIAESYLVEKQFKKALSYTLKGKKIADELNLLDAQHKVEELLSSIYENTGNYKKAFESHQQYKRLNDSLFNKENIEKIAQIEYDYKYKQALDSASIRELRLTKTVMATSQDLEETRSNLLLGIVIFLATASILGGSILSLKLRNAKSKNQNIVIEQKLLRSQMTPHFIFNSLSVLQGMILNKEEKTSISYLSKFSKLLRTILENSRHKAVALQDELSAVNDYIGLQNLDVEPPFKYTLSVASDIDQSAIKIPPMLIQPFIENAIEHAFPNKRDDKQIDLALTFKDATLVCTISDNGVGINAEQQHTHKNKNSLATKITSERLKVLSKDYNQDGSVSIKNRETFGEQGTLVTLVIPYKIETIS